MYVAKVAIERICLLPNDLGRSFHGSLLRKKSPTFPKKRAKTFEWVAVLILLANDNGCYELHPEMYIKYTCRMHTMTKILCFYFLNLLQNIQ
jgi:hypothetical protein